MPHQVLYVVVAKSLQDYILRGDKLRLMVGGSELIEDLPNQFLIKLLKSLGFDENTYIELSRAAGGARLLFNSRQNAEKLARVVPLAVNLYAPGLDIVQHIETIETTLAEAMTVAEHHLQIRRNRQFPSFPVAGPLVDRAPRTGLPVHGSITQAGERELADAGMIAKEHAASRVTQISCSALLAKVIPVNLREDVSTHLTIPDQMDQLATTKQSYLAIFHADANGLGMIVTGLLEELAKQTDINNACSQYREFSAAIAVATERAIQQALAPIITEAIAKAKVGATKTLPFRPLVCAGDDVTLILRAQDAMKVAKEYLKAFEETSLEQLGKFNIPSLDSTGLHAAAGIAFVKKNFPFAQGYRLCESLCAYAKEATNRRGSSLAFWRVTSTIADAFKTICDRELTIDDMLLTMMPYTLDGPSPHPKVDDLLHLVNAAEAMRGRLRRLLTDIYRGRTAAQLAYDRIRDVANARRETAGHDPAPFTQLQEALSAVTDGNNGAELWRDIGGGRVATPLYDAVELLAATGRTTG